MKRGMVGGAYRGPVAVSRQRRTIRFIQALLILIAAGLLAFAGYSYGHKAGFEDGQRADEIDAPAEPSASQGIVLAILGLGAFAGALILQVEGGVRLLTPAKLRELEEAGALPIALEEEEEAEAASGQVS